MDSIEQTSPPLTGVQPDAAPPEASPPESSGAASPLRIALIGADEAGLPGSMKGLADRKDLADAGFGHVLIPDLLRGAATPGMAASEPPASAAIAELVAGFGSGVVLIDLLVDCVSADGDIAREHPELFAGSDQTQALDPRRIPTPHLAKAVLHRPGDAERLGEWWGGLVAGWTRDGLAGVRLRGLADMPPGSVPLLVQALRQQAPDALVIADTGAVAWEDIAALAGLGLDGVQSSLAWWNWRDGWFGDELAMLRRVAPVVADLDPRRPGTQITPDTQNNGEAALSRALAFCAGMDLGWIAPPDPVVLAAASLGRQLGRQIGAGTTIRPLSAADAPIQVLLRCDGSDPRWSRKAAILLFNARVDRPATIDPGNFLTATGGSFQVFTALDGSAGTLIPGVPVGLRAGEWKYFEAAAVAAPRMTPIDRQSAIEAATWPRLALESITPAVDGGLFPVKRIAGETIEVEANIIGDGHDILSAAVQWRAPGEQTWQEARMRLLGNDRWAASFPLLARGLHHYRVEAWRDHYATYRHELGAKSTAGVPITLELVEGLNLLRAAVSRKAPGAASIASTLADIEKLDEPAQCQALLAPALATLMDAADDRPHSIVSSPMPVDAERTAAGFASWYEVFPRSMSDDPHRHGTFADVERHLPRIRAMGFDVLYFPPVHPIGRINRKGPNNTLTPGPEDTGSPYAVGSAEGGHDALHPDLGTLEDFLHLRRAAEAHGLEIALDFAIQCAPDHPWLREHKDWFAWRPDGTVRYAENPPKKYQDIVNVDFYASGSVPDLWLALANVVMFWADQGIRLFRVDNPHTKPMPFWQWMIAEVRARYPEAVFLAEAFTRPHVMNRLAKVGFGQSYTYFTWRNTKSELTEYLTELSTEAPRDFFRPHFFVNTPDINPVFLQSSGRPGFLIRAALAATLSGLWGVYNGFELCEGAALPGREEYLDSEKYQIRTWDWQRPGNIVAEITRLNAIRAENPALHNHLDVAFLPAGNDAVLFYEKTTADRSSCVLCMVSLDPHHAQTSSIELPLWKWGLPDQATLQLQDLIGGEHFQLAGKYHNVTLTPQQPYLIWRATAAS